MANASRLMGAKGHLRCCERCVLFASPSWLPGLRGVGACPRACQLCTAADTATETPRETTAAWERALPHKSRRAPRVCGCTRKQPPRDVFEAVDQNNVSFVKGYLESGGDPNAADDSGRSLLYIADLREFTLADSVSTQTVCQGRRSSFRCRSVQRRREIRRSLEDNDAN